MNLTLGHTEPFQFHLDYIPLNCEFFAVKLKNRRFPSIFHVEEDEFYELYILLVDTATDEILGRGDDDLIEVWEPIFMNDFTIMSTKKKPS